MDDTRVKRWFHITLREKENIFKKIKNLKKMLVMRRERERKKRREEKYLKEEGRQERNENCKQDE